MLMQCCRKPPAVNKMTRIELLVVCQFEKDASDYIPVQNDVIPQNYASLPRHKEQCYFCPPAMPFKLWRGGIVFSLSGRTCSLIMIFPFAQENRKDVTRPKVSRGCGATYHSIQQRKQSLQTSGPALGTCGEWLRMNFRASPVDFETLRSNSNDQDGLPGPCLAFLPLPTWFVALVLYFVGPRRCLQYLQGMELESGCRKSPSEK